jgi:hypothetical protein
MTDERQDDWAADLNLAAQDISSEPLVASK